ncbi:MAG TPA: hypothetical protein VD864_07525 [Nocardioides sp.]|nr:hypothetical protein [Nocardioides sp.]
MTTWQSSDDQGLVEIAEPPEGVIQIHLEEVGRHSWKSALFGAVIAGGGGPIYRFVAAAQGAGHEETDHAAAGARFPLQFFQDLDDETDDKWTELARRRLAELDAELVRIGWHRLPERGPHWWSLRYEW